MLQWLRGLGKAGELAAAAITLIDAKITWAVVVSAALGVLAGLWAGLFDFFSNAHTQIAVGVFLATLWTYIGFRVLRSFRETVRVQAVPDLRYCINPEGFQLAIDPKSTDAALQLSFNFRNASPWPLRFRIEEFRLMIEDRTCPDPENIKDMILPRTGGRAFRSGTFKSDVLKAPRNSGSLSVTIIYGLADGEFVRKYRFKTKLQFAFSHDDKGSVVMGAVAEEFISEDDLPI